MSANSLNRYTPVPPISPTQPVDEKKMSSKKETKQTQSSDLNISGGAAIFSKPPVIKRQSSVTARTAGADSKEKKVPDADADAKANCTQVEMQSNGEAEKEVTSAAATDAVEHELVQSQERIVEMKNEDASLTVKENADSTAAVNGSNDDDYDDDQSHQVSVSFVLHV